MVTLNLNSLQEIWNFSCVSLCHYFCSFSCHEVDKNFRIQFTIEVNTVTFIHGNTVHPSNVVVVVVAIICQRAGLVNAILTLRLTLLQMLQNHNTHTHTFQARIPVLKLWSNYGLLETKPTVRKYSSAYCARRAPLSNKLPLLYGERQGRAVFVHTYHRLTGLIWVWPASCWTNAQIFNVIAKKNPFKCQHTFTLPLISLCININKHCWGVSDISDIH
jgi:hypothetical protein